MVASSQATMMSPRNNKHPFLSHWFKLITFQFCALSKTISPGNTCNNYCEIYMLWTGGKVLIHPRALTGSSVSKPRFFRNSRRRINKEAVQRTASSKSLLWAWLIWKGDHYIWFFFQFWLFFPQVWPSALTSPVTQLQRPYNSHNPLTRILL